jgi:DNA anti-recombination protein RmuC
MPTLIDTRKAFRQLQEEGGFTQEQADAIVDVFAEADEQVATRSDLEQLRQELEDTEDRLRNHIDTVEGRLGEQIDTVEGRLREQIETVDGRLGEQIETVDGRLREQIETVDGRLREHVDTMVGAAEERIVRRLSTRLYAATTALAALLALLNYVLG